MRWSVLGSAVLAVLLVIGCGGDVTRDPGSGGSTGSGPNATGGTGAGTSFPSEPLGECTPGFSHYQNPKLPCPWLGDGLCYSEKDEACACVCPKDHDSWCMSDFPSSDGTPALVTCD